VGFGVGEDVASASRKGNMHQYQGVCVDQSLSYAIVTLLETGGAESEERFAYFVFSIETN
jgi:hypothetical protein